MLIAAITESKPISAISPIGVSAGTGTGGGGGGGAPVDTVHTIAIARIVKTTAITVIDFHIFFFPFIFIISFCLTHTNRIM